jgi:hypothetical protein
MPKAALLSITRAPKSEDPIVAAMRLIRKRQRESYKALDALAENENEATAKSSTVPRTRWSGRAGAWQ